METKTELKYEYWTEIKKCDACHEWIENKMCKLNRNGKFLFFHPFCFYCLTNKNPLYKSLNDKTITNNILLNFS